MFESVGESCGVIALRGVAGAAGALACHGLVALQHRGQESAGVVVAGAGGLSRQCGHGLVQQVFEGLTPALPECGAALGHVRYATAGGSGAGNVQPLLGQTRRGDEFALAHNGHLLRVAGHDGWAPGTGAADTATLAAAVGAEPGGVRDALLAVLPKVEGAYSIAVLDGETVHAARDPYGFRPLCLGRLAGGGWVVASESAALECLGARYLREVEPGELVTLDGHGLRGERFAAASPAGCVFEYVYFARADSMLGGVRVHQARHAMGVALAGEAPVEADVVVAVPDSGRPAALGYASASGLYYAEALARNAYAGRTFLQPSTVERRRAVRLKFGVLPELVADRRVVMVDDSLVRANSARDLVSLVRAAGAREVHLRIASPPVRWPCFFGVDLPTRAELAAGRRGIREVAELVRADSLGYLSVEAMVAACGPAPKCVGCFTGTYPTG
ncbi:amidophosphoribosyltransferase [Phytohabitans houttuyneae]|uniref:Amidophosphoribosyltransferase n=1 Tax=Phytohabitans houttuyneae TaxID=1076126 RepID=A0A6V8KG54_9ACTN|nr:amidophosphoribosyltransferase [Phytohabitans houttuyneae]GFJ81069.1 amidophosphoribosyltransferase [Phytohabitans houttuyneae]